MTSSSIQVGWKMEMLRHQQQQQSSSHFYTYFTRELNNILVDYVKI